MELWDRQIGEPVRWFVRFRRYLALEPTRRSYTKVYDIEKAEEFKRRGKLPPGPSRSVPGYWMQYITQWEWKKRSEAYDLHLISERDLRSEARRQQQIEDEWAMRDLFLQNLKSMAMVPVVRRVVNQEDGSVTIKPARWSKNTMIRFSNAIVQLGRLAAEMSLPEDGSVEKAVRTEAVRHDMDWLKGI